MITRPHEHGTHARFTQGCHCDLCTRANDSYQRLAFDVRHATPTRNDDLEALETALDTRRHALESMPGPDAAARLDELDRLEAHLTRLAQARDRART